jgi:hypothetical protein
MRSSPVLLLSLAASLLTFAPLGCGGTTAAIPADTSADAGSTDDASPPQDDGSPGDAVDDGYNGAPSDTYPAPHPPLPTLTSSGGPVLEHPKVLPIFFPSYDYRSEIATFASTLGTTPHWQANGQEYGVGPLTSAKPVDLTEQPPTTISDQGIQQWLSTKLQNGALGPIDSTTIYTIFYPSSTTITMGGFGGSSKSCQSFGGYHSNLSVNNANVAYAVIPECKQSEQLTGIDAVTAATSHEWIEASTDPFPQSAPAYSGVDDDHLIWQFALSGGEDGDLCAQNLTSYYKPQGFNFTVQRAWSNQLGKASHDPCAPDMPGEVYFNSAPVLPETVTIGGFGQTFTTKGVTIKVGNTKTIEVDLFSDAATSGPWKVTAVDIATLSGQPPTLSFKWDRQTGVNGEKLHVSITANKQGQFGTGGFMIESSLGNQLNFWPGLVKN